MRLTTRARRARAQLLALTRRSRLCPDHAPEDLLLVVEAAAVQAAARRVLRLTPVPRGLSAEAAAGWRAARSAAVLALVAQADLLAPPPPAPGRLAPPRPGGPDAREVRTGHGLDWSQEPR
ncbi:hypothetical protein [Streptomyces sp. NPDC091278]|uniref:hypothetical protein n=1 Tax=Streptomyces sp. NPDC091278 TaxID=3155301 RepID=UPI00344BBA25